MSIQFREFSNKFVKFVFFLKSEELNRNMNHKKKSLHHLWVEPLFLTVRCVRICIIILLKWVTVKADSMWSVLSGWETEAVLGWQIAEPWWWGQDHHCCTGYCICRHLEIMKPFSVDPLPCSISIISLKKSGQLLHRMRTQSMQSWSHVSERLLGFVGT